MDGAGTREIPIRQSLVRSKLLMGGERIATIWNFIVAFIIVLTTENVIGILSAVAIAAVIQAVLVMLAKWDPQAIEVVSRARKYQTFYGNAATLDAEPGVVHVPERAPLAILLSFLRSKKGASRAEH